MKGDKNDPITQKDLPITLKPGLYWFAIPQQVDLPLEATITNLWQPPHSTYHLT